MARIALNLYGLNKDTSPYNQEMKNWTDSNNVQFDNANTRKTNGYVEVMADSGSVLPAPYWVTPWTIITASYWIVAGLTRVFKTTGNGTFDNINKLRTSASTTDPLSSTASSTTVTIDSTAHGGTTGDRVKISGYTMSTSGLVEEEVNSNHVITVLDADSYTITVTTAASDTVSGFGGSSGTLKYETAYTSSSNWNGGVLSGILVINNGKDDPQYISPSQSELSDLSNWPASTTCSVIRPYKNFLIALNTVESGTEYPYRVRWSHSAEPGTVPSSWDESDASLDAGINDLSQSPGFLVDCLTLRDTNIIYKEDSVWSMTHVGGNSVFRFQQLFDDVGMLAPRCVKVFDEKHFVVAHNDVYVHDGVQKTSVVNNTVRDWLFNNIDTDNYDKTFVTANYPRSEMWICFPETGETLCTRALIWNWRENVWSTRDLPNVSHIGWGIISDYQEEVSWDADSGTWESDTEVWGERSYNPSDLRLLGAGTDDVKLFHMDATSQADGVDYLAYVERSGLLFGGERLKHINRLYPRITSTGPVTLSIGSEDFPGQGVDYQVYTFNPLTEWKIDTRVSGRFIALRIESESSTSWSVQGIDLEMQDDGER